MPTANERKNWVFTPSQDFEPGKSLALGQILEDAFQAAVVAAYRCHTHPQHFCTD